MYTGMRNTALLLSLGAALVAGCGSSGDDSSSSSTAASTAASTSTAAAAPAASSLKGVCPDTVVIQTDWFPESDHSESYAIAADDGKVDKNKKRYTAALMDGATDTGVKVEIRAGGPAIGFQAPTQQMYQDSSIMLGYVNTDSAVKDQAKQPTLSVMAPREGWPQVLIYDPAHYDFKTVADVGKSGATVLAFQGAAWTTYFANSGLLEKKQIDTSYDGKPARFIASGGKVVQQGFITAEPWQYEHTVKQWGKPVKTLLLSQAGYNQYGEALGIKKGDLAKDAPCLKKLVPIIQRAQVAYAKEPSKTNALIARIVKEQNAGWVYPVELADYAAKAQVDNKIIADGPTPALGDFDMPRVQKMITLLKPIYAKQHIKVPDDLKPEDMYTNEFIDPAISLGGS
jgi:hypothetical protein